MGYADPRMTAGDPALRARARLLSGGIIEITCTGQLRAQDVDYLPELAQLIEAQTGRVSLVFETLAIEGYSPEFPLRHVDFFKQYRARLHRIAVVHELKSIAFAVATVSLASSTSIKGFASMREALGWLRAS